MATIQAQFGRRIRALREARGWSQEGFAEACGLHRTYIGGIERGERNVSLVNIERIAVALGVGIAELFSAETTERTPVGPWGRRGAGGRS